MLVTMTAAGFYDPSLQRWINRDPLGESGFEQVGAKNSNDRTSPNAYLFVYNDPLDLVDPRGLMTACEQDCYDDAKNNLKRSRTIAICWGGAAGLGGGALGSSGKGGLGKGLGVGVVVGAATFLVVDLLGDAYALTAWLGCMAGCAWEQAPPPVYSPPAYPSEWPGKGHNVIVW